MNNPPHRLPLTFLAFGLFLGILISWLALDFSDNARRLQIVFGLILAFISGWGTARFRAQAGKRKPPAVQVKRPTRGFTVPSKSSEDESSFRFHARSTRISDSGQAPVGVFSLDCHGAWAFLNDLSYVITGMPKQPEAWERWWRYIHQEDRRRVIHGIRRAILEAEAFVTEHRVVAAGRVTWVLTQILPAFDERGHLLGFAGSVTDRTHEHRVEQERARLAAAVEQTADGVLITDLEGRISYVNPAFEGMTGYSLSEVLGKNPRILKSGLHPPEFYAELWRELLSGRVWRGQVSNKKKDGGVYREKMTISPVIDERGQLSHFVALKRDVTRERNLELQVQKAQRMEAVGRVAGGLAHDFNNTLTILNGYTDLLAEEFGNQQPYRNYFQSMRLASREAIELIRQLLAFSRRQVANPQILNVNFQLKKGENLIRGVLGDRIDLQCRYQEVEERIRFDPAQFDQILMNLAVNARDAMPSGGSLLLSSHSVWISEEDPLGDLEAKPGNFVRLTMEDTGYGMTQEVQERAFEPFFSTKDEGQGSGLGLSTVYGMVRQGGGFVRVSSTPGKGSTFELFFPALSKTNLILGA
ncbi:MAG: PAS domain S-box protein [Planctomycetota bacterium]|nr:MAG: PAS domain S-box protein [Planctomycetota bacterium]